MINDHLPSLAERYVQHCDVIRNYTKTTIRNHRQVYKIFFRETGIESIEEFTTNRIEKWFFEGRLEKKWGAATFRHQHKYLNCFAKWLIKKELLKSNPLDDIEKPKLEQKMPRALDKEQAKIILDTSFHMQYRYKLEKYRNRALIGIMLYAGLRRNETLKLKLNDVSVENKTIFINQGKGSKDRLIPINYQLGIILREYLKERNRLPTATNNFFVGITRECGLAEKGLNRLIWRIRKKCKIHFSAHVLRHTFATLMIEGGCDIYTLSKIMGHNKITTTTIYLACSKTQMAKGIEMHSLN